jgi:hypothetical protein
MARHCSIVCSRTSRCSLDNAKRSYYRYLNAIFGEICRNASEKVILQLVSSARIPILMYGLEAFFLIQSATFGH